MEQCRIFRKTSIEKLASPEQLDTLIHVVSPKGWISLICIGVILIVAITWGFTGSLSTKVSGSGILIKSGGIRNVIHNFSGIITDIRVSAGDIIKDGDVVARIEQNDIVEKINSLKEQLNYFNKLSFSNIVISPVTGRSITVIECIKEINGTIVNLQNELEFESNVTSQYSGKVLEVKLNKGEMLQAGQTVLSLEIEGNTMKDLEGILYVSAELGKSLSPGMDVEISPSVVKKEEFGFMRGKVVSVSDYPATYQGMYKILGSDELVKRFMNSGSATEVHVELVPDSKTVSGYHWSTQMGPPRKIDSGTLCTGEVIVGKEKPIKLILPMT